MEVLRADYADVKRKFADFFDGRHGEPYLDAIRDSLTEEGSKRRIVFDLSDLRKYDEPLVRSLLRNPVEIIPPLEEALKERAKDEVAQLDDDDRKKVGTLQEELRVGFTGPFGYHRVTPRELLSTFLNTLVRVEGIITKASLISPKLQQSVHYCETTGKYTVRSYADVTALNALPTGAAYPTKDDAGNPLVTEYGYCRFVDYQCVTIQEAPETAPPGQLPRSVDVMLEGDLVDVAKPGDRVSLVGVFRAAPQRATGQVNGVMRAVVVANYLEVTSGQTSAVRATPDEIGAIRDYGRKHSTNMLDILASSLAPSIYGHKEVKKALILQLVGGVGKTLENGTALRGDINMLLVGDPGVAKSQMLRAAMNVAPLAVSTTGRGSSGVGLTAAVTQDRETGERRLEAGAMVLADRGVVCIDEFDKMSDVDRVAIHEVMEQQTVTIAKAGIHTTLNARCSVLAAANPIFGSYDPRLSIPRNINLPDSLLSRFDLLFILVDKSVRERDAEIAAHVLRMHNLASTTGAAAALDVRDRLAAEEVGGGAAAADEELDEEAKFFLPKASRIAGRGAKIFRPAFIRKFVAYVRRRYTPTQFTPEAQTRVKEYYAELRSEASEKRGLPVTARTLETIIRLATAHAKVRLDNKSITLGDVEVAMGVMDAALSRGAHDDAEDDSDDESGGAAEAPKRERRARKTQSQDAQPAKKRRVGRKGKADAEEEEAEMEAIEEEEEAAPAVDLEAAAPAADEGEDDLGLPAAELLPAGRADPQEVLRGLSEKDRDALSRALAAVDPETGCNFDDFHGKVSALKAKVNMAQVMAFLSNEELEGRIMLDHDTAHIYIAL